LEELEQYCETIETFRPPTSSTGTSLTSLLRGLGSGRPLATRPYYFAGMEQKIRGIVQSRAVDLVQIEHLSWPAIAMPFHRRLGAGRFCRSITWVRSVPEDRFAEDRHRLSTWILAKAALMQGWEARIASRFDRCLVVSAKEGELLHAEDPTLPISVIKKEWTGNRRAGLDAASGRG